MAAAVLDKDYRCDKERRAITTDCEAFCNYTIIYTRKEIENFPLVPAAMDRAAARKVADQAKRTGTSAIYSSNAAALLDNFSLSRKSYVTAQYLAERRRFERINSPTAHEASVNVDALDEVENCWKDENTRLEIIPGKEAISFFNQHLQEKYRVSVTPTAIIDAMRPDEVPTEMQTLIHDIARICFGDLCLTAKCGHHSVISETLPVPLQHASRRPTADFVGAE